MSYRAFWLVGPAIIVQASTAYAVKYFSVEEAQRFIFPEATTFERWELNLSQEKLEAIEERSGSHFESSEQRVWKAKKENTLLGYFIVDEVYGKHELITYTVALNPDRSIKQVEILDYRETRGGEIRDENWRKQFSGKKFGDGLKLDRDITNISGATISCKHITEGVGKILTLFNEIERNESS